MLLVDNANGGLVELRLKPVHRRYFRAWPRAARSFASYRETAGHTMSYQR